MDELTLKKWCTFCSHLTQCELISRVEIVSLWIALSLQKRLSWCGILTVLVCGQHGHKNSLVKEHVLGSCQLFGFQIWMHIFLDQDPAHSGRDRGKMFKLACTGWGSIPELPDYPVLEVTDEGSLPRVRRGGLDIVVCASPVLVTLPQWNLVHRFSNRGSSCDICGCFAFVSFFFYFLACSLIWGRAESFLKLFLNTSSDKFVNWFVSLLVRASATFQAYAGT